jgi:O-antigen/teichoic acid export membrane protein
MIRERSLRANSLSSLFASGGVFAITLAMPAVLARSIVASDYQTYATAMAFLPLALLLSQSLRNCAGSALIVAMQKADGPDVARAYRRIVLLATGLVLAGGASIIEFLRFFSLVGDLDQGLLRFGSYCVLINVSGIGFSLLVTGPATASQDFVPENLLKLAPPALLLTLLAAIFIISPGDKLWWIFAAVAVSPWPLAGWLMFRYHGAVARWFETNQAGKKPVSDFSAPNAIFRFLLLSSASVGWWNLTAYFATSITVAIVALTLPNDVAAFGMAFSLIGLLSGGLIAISAPIASRVASIPLHDTATRVAAFRRFNRYFIVYTLAVAFFVLLVPARIYELWVGPQYAGSVRTMLLLLLPATILRLQTMCFTLFVMSLGRQSSLWLSPMVEAIVATLASFLLVSVLGIEGIALALTLSATVRLAMTLGHDIRLNQDLFPIEWNDLLIPKLVRAR